MPDYIFFDSLPVISCPPQGLNLGTGCAESGELNHRTYKIFKLLLIFINKKAEPVSHTPIV